jgi:hypothetical protein
LERNARTILLNSKGAEINKNPAEGKVFFVDFSSYRTFRAVRITSEAKVKHSMMAAASSALPS